MNNYKENLVKEHSELIVRIEALNSYVYSSASDKDDKVEFANKCIQLASMREYEQALRARMENSGVYFNSGVYLEKVATILPAITVDTFGPCDVDQRSKMVDSNSPKAKDE